jgi:hypothetical protein
MWAGALVSKEVCFFEKKKQKTFTHAANASFKSANFLLPAISKSFLVLFFKKELLSSF